MIHHPRSAEHYFRVERERLPGENRDDALSRTFLEDALREGMTLYEAAAFLGVTYRTVRRRLDAAAELRTGTPERTEELQMRANAVELGLIA